MSTDPTAEAVLSRFLDEQRDIRRFTDFVGRRVALGFADIDDARGILRSWKLPAPRVTRRLPQSDSCLTQVELQEIVASLGVVMPALAEAVREAESQESILAAEVEAAESSQHLVDWVDYLDENWADHLFDTDRTTVIGQCRQQWDVERTVEDDEFNESVVEQAITCCTLYRVRRKLNALRTALTTLEECDMLARTSYPGAAINVSRQGFVLLMTAFDAAMFDLVRVALRRRFFSLVPAFGDRDKSTLTDMGNAGCWDSFRAQIIEEQLKKRFLKDLLFLLGDKWKVRCIDEAAGEKFERLIEFVLRRNVHIHNRGIVDARYLDEKLNLDRLALGDVAIIDEPYLRTAHRICLGCVERVAAWAGA